MFPSPLLAVPLFPEPLLASPPLKFPLLEFPEFPIPLFAVPELEEPCIHQCLLPLSVDVEFPNHRYLESCTNSGNGFSPVVSHLPQEPPCANKRAGTWESSPQTYPF